MPSATLTSKGQITIPVEVRRRLGLKTGDRVDFVFHSNGGVTLRTKRIPFEQLRGILKRPGQKRMSLRDMDRAIADSVRKRWLRATRVRTP